MSSRRGRRSLGDVIRARAEEAKPFTLREACFESQYKFISDPSRFKTACTSRRAGKSGGIIRDMVGTCLAEKNIICLYVTITSRNARNIIWGDLKKLLEEYKIQVKTDDTRMTVVFKETGSEIRVGGAKDESQIENYRGWKLRKAYVDEAQSFRPYLRYFIDDILLPSLRDLRGDLMITGTPGPLLSGPFYEYTHSEFLSHHHWTAFDNPFMHNLERNMDLNLTLAEERQMRGITETDPSYIRETFGKWIEDLDSLVYKLLRFLLFHSFHILVWSQFGRLFVHLEVVSAFSPAIKHSVTYICMVGVGNFEFAGRGFVPLHQKAVLLKARVRVCFKLASPKIVIQQGYELKFSVLVCSLNY